MSKDQKEGHPGRKQGGSRELLSETVTPEGHAGVAFFFFFNLKSPGKLFKYWNRVLLWDL